MICPKSALLAIVSLCLALPLASAELPKVTLLRTPDGGIQPQAAAGEDGTIHLIYYKGESSGGDIFYVRQKNGDNGFSKPLQVNSRPQSAMSAGTIRGAQLALGRNGRVHVAWNGHAPAKGNWMDAPMLYTRLNDAGSAFEPERNLITSARGLDGGGSVAADKNGNVYVMWHAPQPGNTNGELGRALFVSRSNNDGKSFTPETLATAQPTGACACCGMKAFADDEGNVFALFRAASSLTNRAETLLMSSKDGTGFDVIYSHPWAISTCPMSSASLAQTQGAILAAGETHGRVFFVRADPKTRQISSPVSPEVKAKHPVVVANSRGEVLFVWTEGTGWAKGGSLSWQVYDKDGNPLSRKESSEGIPAWSLATAVAKPDNSFVIIY
jgi:hypothetical protein